MSTFRHQTIILSIYLVSVYNKFKKSKVLINRSFYSIKWIRGFESVQTRIGCWFPHNNPIVMISFHRSWLLVVSRFHWSQQFQRHFLHTDQFTSHCWMSNLLLYSSYSIKWSILFFDWKTLWFNRVMNEVTWVCISQDHSMKF